MFQTAFQGGSHVEVFITQGRDPAVDKCKFHGPQSAVKKEFDKQVKSNVYRFRGDSTVTKVQLPKADKQTLHLIQPFCVLQLLVPSGANIAIDLGLADTGSSRRRILLSSSQRDMSSTPLHARVPLIDLPRDQWMNLCLDVSSLVRELFKGQSFKTLDCLIIGGTFSLRRIFTTKCRPPSMDGDSQHGVVESIPKCCQFPTSVPAVTKVISSAFTATDPASGPTQSPPKEAAPATSRQPSAGERSESAKPTHIAFGRKVEIPEHVLKARQAVGLDQSTSSRGMTASSSLADTSSDLPATEEGLPMLSQQIQPHPPKAPPTGRAVSVRLQKKRLKVLSARGAKKSGLEGGKECPQSSEGVHSEGTQQPHPAYKASLYKDEGSEEPAQEPTIAEHAALNESSHEADENVESLLDPSINPLFSFSSPPKQSLRQVSSPIDLDESQSLGAFSLRASLDCSLEERGLSRRDCLEEDFTSTGADIMQEHVHQVLPGLDDFRLSPKRVVSKGTSTSSVHDSLPKKVVGEEQDEISPLRLSQVYDWRQYKTDDGGSTLHVQSVEARLASLLNAQGQVPSPCGEPQQDPSTSDSVEHDNSLANTLTMTWDDRLRDLATPLADVTELRGSMGLSPPVTLMAPLADEFVSEQQPMEGWQGLTTADKDDEVELMYDATLNCFYDPKTCKYYVLQ